MSKFPLATMGERVRLIYQLAYMDINLSVSPNWISVLVTLDIGYIVISQILAEIKDNIGNGGQYAGEIISVSEKIGAGRILVLVSTGPI